MAQVKHTTRTAQEPASRSSRTFRTFLLLQQFEAKEIGERIGLARKERGLTQEELAEMASFSKRSLQDYEGGLTIPYRHLRELGRLLGKTPEWFLYGENDQAPPTERLDQILSAVAVLQAQVQQLLGEVAALRGQREGPPRAGSASS